MKDQAMIPSTSGPSVVEKEVEVKEVVDNTKLVTTDKASQMELTNEETDKIYIYFETLLVRQKFSSCKYKMLIENNCMKILT